MLNAKILSGRENLFHPIEILKVEYLLKKMVIKVEKHISQFLIFFFH